MAIDFFDGFDDYPGVTTASVGLTSEWIVVGSTGIALAAGRVGGQSLSMSRYTNSFSRFVEESANFSFFTAFLYSSGSANANDFKLVNFCTSTGNNQHVAVGWNTLGQLYVQGPSGSDLARVNAIFNATEWFSIAVAGTIHDSEGTIKVLINGETVIDLTNIDTKNAAASTVGRINLYGTSGVSPPDPYIDDVRYDYDSAIPIKEGRSVPLLPVSDSSVQFTPSSGSANYAMVDEITCDSDTTYNTSNTVGHEDKFGFGSLALNPDEIFAVQLAIAARKDDVATRILQPFLESNSVRANASDFYLGTNYAWRRKILEKNPDGDIAWEKAAVESLLGGYTIIE